MSKGNNYLKYIYIKKQVENQFFNLIWVERILKIFYFFRGIKYMNICFKSLVYMIKLLIVISEERGYLQILVCCLI